jgi:hypothetical protein
LARRALDIGGFPADLAARVVAIATSEMVRVQARSVLRPKPEQPRNAGEGDEHGREHFAVGGMAHLLLLPSSQPLALYGPELSLQHRHGITSQTLYSRWLVGAGDSLLRWFEIGASIDVRLALAPSWTLTLAGKAGGVALAFVDALQVEGRRGSTDWTVHAGGMVGIETRVADGAALLFAVEPGASVRNLDVISDDGTSHNLGGFTLGLSLGLVASPDRAAQKP